MSSTNQIPRNRTMINRLNFIPWHLLHIPGLLLIFLGIYAIYRMVDPMGVAKKIDMAFFGDLLVVMTGYLAIIVGFSLCVAWWYMRGKQWMTTEEAERQRREMACAEELGSIGGGGERGSGNVSVSGDEGKMGKGTRSRVW